MRLIGVWQDGWMKFLSDPAAVQGPVMHHQSLIRSYPCAGWRLFSGKHLWSPDLRADFLGIRAHWRVHVPLWNDKQCVYFVLLYWTALAWWMAWGVCPAADCNEALPPVCERVSVCARADRTRLSFTKLLPVWKLTRASTHTHTHSDHRLRDDECGNQGSP